MQKSNAPTKLTVAFASGTGAGPVNNVPLTPGSTPGTASYQTGFTSVNMEPIASGGVPPFGADFNGVIKNSTTAQIWQQCGYMYPYDSGFASNANINGYPANSVLMMGSGKGFWINQTDNNITSPDATGSTGWLGLPAVGAYTITTTGGTTTPDSSVLGVTTLIIGGALTSNATIVLPLVAGSRWIIANNTTGSFTLTIQGSSGAGVSITQGSALTVFTDGTAYFAASANISGQYLPINGTAVAATKLATARAFNITGLATAAAVNFDGTGNVTFNVTALNVAGALGYTPANDSAVVHLAGAENVSGAKQFTTYQIFNGAMSQSSAPIFGGLALASNIQSPNGEADFVSGNGGASGYGFNFYTRGSSGVLTLIASINTSYAFQTSGAISVGAVNATTGSFSGAVTTGALTCTTFNASSSDRRLKRNIRKFKARPLHRLVPLVSYTLKSNGWSGIGSIAQKVQGVAPEHVGTFDQNGKTYLSLNYAGMAYEESIWAGLEIDRLAKRIVKLERSRLPKKPGFLRRLMAAIW